MDLNIPTNRRKSKRWFVSSRNYFKGINLTLDLKAMEAFRQKEGVGSGRGA